MNTAAQNPSGRACYRLGIGLKAGCNGCGAKIGEPCRPPLRTAARNADAQRPHGGALDVRPHHGRGDLGDRGHR